MSQSPLSILVTGATGRQGGAVARALLARGHKVRALTRKPNSQPAEALRQAGASIATGDFGDRASLARALSEIEAVFAMSTSVDVGASGETRDGIALIDAAKAARVRHLVYSSICGADRGTGIPQFESKWRIEQHLAASDVPFTVLGPAFFMENALGPQGPTSPEVTALSRPLPANRRLQRVALANLAAFAAMVLGRRDRFRGRRIDVASDELSGAEEAEILSQVSGRKVEYTQTSLEELRAASPDEAAMFDWLDRVGYKADIARLRQEYPDVPWLKFPDWAREQTFAAVA